MTWDKCRQAAAQQAPAPDELQGLYEAKYGTTKGVSELMTTQPCLIDPLLYASAHVFLDVYVNDDSTSLKRSTKIGEAFQVLLRMQWDLLHITPAAGDSIWKEMARRNVNEIGVVEAYEQARRFCEPLARRYTWRNEAKPAAKKPSLTSKPGKDKPTPAQRTCNDFNQGKCARVVCKFIHKCEKCRGEHAAIACTASSSTSSDKKSG
jgi:hypothetical protein